MRANMSNFLKLYDRWNSQKETMCVHITYICDRRVVLSSGIKFVLKVLKKGESGGVFIYIMLFTRRLFTLSFSSNSFLCPSRKVNRLFDICFVNSLFATKQHTLFNHNESIYDKWIQTLQYFFYKNITKIDIYM